MRKVVKFSLAVMIILLLATGSVAIALFCVKRDVTFDPGELHFLEVNDQGLMSLHARFTVPISVVNHNYFPIELSGELDGGLASCPRVTLIHATFPSSTVSGRGSIRLQLYGNLTYSPQDDVNMCVAREVGAVCAKSGASLHVKVEVRVTHITWVGPGLESFTKNVQVMCADLP